MGRIARQSLTGAKGDDLAAAYYQLAAVHEYQGRFRNAVKYYEKAFRLKPTYGGVALLWQWLRFALGNCDWVSVQMRPVSGSADVPVWEGQPAAAIFVGDAPDDGVGEQVMKAGMLPALRELADKIIFECDPRLIPVLSRSFPDVEFVTKGNDGGGYTARAGFYELCRYLKPDTSAMVGAAPFIVPKKLHRRDNRFTIGLSWKSKMDASGTRSMSFNDLIGPLVRGMPDCRFVDLQYGETSAELAAAEAAFGVKIERPVDNHEDIDGLISVIDQCDAVITINNSTQHFAGALGKPTWALMPKVLGWAGWYWFINRADSPWYSKMRLIWPERDQDWVSVVELAVDGVQELRLVPGGRNLK
jgi:tetratricopeptide (TPR) repeat protein